MTWGQQIQGIKGINQWQLVEDNLNFLRAVVFVGSVTLGQGKCHGSGMMSAPLVRPGLSSISALLLTHEVSQDVLGAACSLLGWVWRTLSTPKAMLVDHCLCFNFANSKILKVYQKLMSGGRKLSGDGR